MDTKIGMPAMETMYISAILKESHDVFYTRDKNHPKLKDADYVIFPTSIIAHETEIEVLENLKNKKIFVTGIFSNVLKNKYQKDNTIVIKNESDTFFFNLNKSKNIRKEFLDNLFKTKEKINEFYSPVSLDDLPYPDWEDM